MNKRNMRELFTEIYPVVREDETLEDILKKIDDKKSSDDESNNERKRR